MKTMPSPSCPSADELQAFAVGNLSEITLARIAGNLETCQRCEVLLPAFDAAADGLLAGLSRLNGMEPQADVELPEELVTAARQAAQAPANGKSADVSLDCGRRYARQLAAGACRLGKFELQAELGTGSFGHVFRARDTELDRTVAVKIQRAGSLADDEEASRFQRE